jgi:hypothetical protein
MLSPVINKGHLTEYETAVQFHHRIEDLYPEVERHHAWFRGFHLVGRNVPVPTDVRSGVDTDRVYCALAVKAATTKRSIFTLCEAGDGDNASALARVLMENAYLMRWMLGGIGRDRLETYVLFMSVLHERTIRVVDKHFGHHPDFVRLVMSKSDPYHKAVARSVFGNHQNTWAYFPVPNKPGKLRQVKIVDIFKDVSEGDDFAYEGPYASGSQFIHSGPESLFETLKQLMRSPVFQLSPMPLKTHRGTAIASSNASMLTALKALDEFIGLNLSERIEAIATEWRAYAKQTLAKKKRRD